MKEKQDYLFIGIITLAFVCLIVFVGIYRHNNKENTPTPSPTVTTSPTSEVEEETEDGVQVHEHCTRTGTLTGGSTDLSYEIYYTGKVLNRVESTEKVISDDDEILDQYEGAYRAIHAHYEGLEYYDTNVIRTDDSVTSIIIIDYDHIDIDELISIEGEEDNIFEDKIPRISKWRALSRKVGMKCSKVE